MNRSDLLRGFGALGAAAVLPGIAPAYARDGVGPLAATANGERLFDFVIDSSPLVLDGRNGSAIAINGSVPAPLLRAREGETAVVRVTNRLKESTSIHWHGLLIPNDMDGVPGVTFRGIDPGQTFIYRLPIKQNGTYWFHSHTGLQEQVGLYGPIILDPAGPDPVVYDREHVLMLSDWTFDNPMTLIAKLRKQSGYFNFQKLTAAEYMKQARAEGRAPSLVDRSDWARMRMDPTDLADVTAYTYTYLMNGLTPQANWTALFKPGEKVRLRVVGGAAMTIFDVRIPGLKMTVVQADGQNVQPVTVDEFRVAPGETYDVIVQPTEDRAYTIFAETSDRSGYARGALAPRPGMTAAIPPRRPRPLLSMADMGMDMMKGMAMPGMSPTPSPPATSHVVSRTSFLRPAVKRSAKPHVEATPMSGMSGMAGMAGMAGMDMSSKPAAEASGTPAPPSSSMGDMAGMSMPGMDMRPKNGATAPPSPSGGMAGMDVSGGRMSATRIAAPSNGAYLPGSPPVAHGPDTHGVENSMSPMEETNRLGEPGTGLENTAGHRVLVYTDLKSLDPQMDRRDPIKTLELHLTGNMERYMWSFDGKKYSEAGAFQFRKGERVRMILVNDTMMEHPIHLHGMYMELENGAGTNQPYKHTIRVKPAERLSVAITPEVPGNWALHCHLLMHMELGMMRVAQVIA